MSTPQKSSREKVHHRKRLSRQGLRPIQIWVPNVHSRAFAREAHRQSLLVAGSATADDDQAFVDAISDQSD
jgi:antidote-toxin recognition MazE-like antitoxin